jgi:hypothetical protein
MSPKNYLLGTGYCHRPDAASAREMWRLWKDNTAKATPPARRTVVIAVDGDAPPDLGDRMALVALDGNLGHIHHLIGKELPRKSHALCGWSASILALAMIAYVDESDFLYKEADCLAFGSWVEQMYTDLGDGDIVFGGPMTSEPWLACSQSLFLIRHGAIPSFVSAYLAFGPDSETLLPEDKFASLAQGASPLQVRHLSFGVDRERPVPFDSAVFYAQQLTPSEVAMLADRGLI